jgi:putative endonuclease
MNYYVYMLLCSNRSYYTGYTTDLQRRYHEHVAGLAKCKYTRSFPPLELAAYWCVGDELSVALQIEAKIKKLTKKRKHWLVAEPTRLLEIVEHTA